MPLLDHFHSPLFPARRWESFHSLWCAAIVERLNADVLPAGYYAETQVHFGSRVETDVATLQGSQPISVSGNGHLGGVAVEAYAPPAPAAVVPACFPDEIEIQVIGSPTGAHLVGAIEMISPGNKDRPEARRTFACKCVAYLQVGIGLLIVDVVTERLANLHAELIDLMGWNDGCRLPANADLYAVAYRPIRRDPGGDQIDLWLEPLMLGESLPVMPLALRGASVIPVDLEWTYTEARRRARL